MYYKEIYHNIADYWGPEDLRHSYPTLTAIFAPSKLLLKQTGKSSGSASAVKLHSARSELSEAIVGDDDNWTKVKTLLKPEDQLELTDEELLEDVTRVLTATNPQTPQNIVEFNFKDCCFVPVPTVGHIVEVLNIEGTCLLRDSEEGRNQIILEGGVVDGGESAEGKESRRSSNIDEEADGQTEHPEETLAEEEEAPADDAGGEGEDKDDEDGGRKDSSVDVIVPAGGPKKVINQFNYCDRAALTYNNPFREVDTQTLPPARDSFNEQIFQFTIFDAYQEDYEALKQEKEKEKEKKEKVPSTAAPKKEDTRKKDVSNPEVEQLNRMLMAAKTLERMVNLNTFDEIAQDYRYWEDPSDEFREEEGTLLPLWKFAYEKTKKNNVTDICWNPCYYDLFAVTFGSFDFMKPQPEGAICLFTLKNPSHPEYACLNESGVMCVDIHPTHSYLLCVGFYDGNVAVYDVHIPLKEPQYKSNSVKHKHTGVTWQVKWGPDMTDGEMNFYSVGSDGLVFNWVLMQNELAQIVIISLTLDNNPSPGPDGAMIQLQGCGTAFAFHPTQPLIFLVGTEEGTIYKCSTAYSSMFLKTYDAHQMPVHKIDYNKFYPEIFVSCSADWRVKVWDDSRRDPLFVFDLASPVGDVQWAPYSSTVFGAVTLDGKVHVFDVNVNKYRAICVQPVVSKKKYKLTRLAFNYRMPIMICGDDKGNIITLKLSPNLRKKVKPPKKGPQLEPRELEILKLEKLLALVREPAALSHTKEVSNVSN
ncbi:dynein intermediate chain 2, ciliary-like [Anabrus simplex]|uniref:dynein intermediate chain 2, ciliary-like n=1 Tax=Anabrus simplex TaxID=316456 RepID=UPI0035A385E0